MKVRLKSETRIFINNEPDEIVPAGAIGDLLPGEYKKFGIPAKAATFETNNGRSVDLLLTTRDAEPV